jgi:hypothetical protein
MLIKVVARFRKHIFIKITETRKESSLKPLIKERPSVYQETRMQDTSRAGYQEKIVVFPT